MRILLDTHILLWALFSPDKLSEEALSYLKDDRNDFAYSLISLWEVELKHCKNPAKMPVSAKLLEDLCNKFDFTRVELKPEHILNLHKIVCSESVGHKDPFDKMLLSQADCDNYIFLTHDSKLSHYNLSNIKSV